MARTDLSIPVLGNKFVDIRETIPGDSFNWSWTRPLSQVNYLAIHHTAGPDTQTPTEIALYHINNNGWTGVGYHFLIAKDGTVFYVGDISTARANVANLNEQVLGICLIGSFISGRQPTNAQIDSVAKLCDFFINNYPALTNVTSWDDVRGHKELPGQSTVCPGDAWPTWRTKIISGGGPVTPTPTGDRGAQITALYRTVLGRDPDMGGLQTYTNSNMNIDEIRKAMTESLEHQDIISKSKQAVLLQEQVNGLQQNINVLNSQIMSLSSQVSSLQSQLAQKQLEIDQLKNQLANQPVPMPPPAGGPVPQPQPQPHPLPQPNPQPPKPTVDTTLSLPEVIANIFKYLFVKRN